LSRTRALWPLLMVAALAGCTIGTPPATDQEERPPTAPSGPTPTTATTRPAPVDTIAAKPPPKVGECRYVPPNGFTFAWDISRLTECSDEHNAQTFYVGETSVDDSVPDYAGILAEVGCQDRLTAFLGTADWLATRLHAVPFAPPTQEWHNGARWVR
jgi:hypothetical protein